MCRRATLQQRGDRGWVEGSGGENADGAVGGHKAFFGYDAPEGRLEQAQQADFRSANPAELRAWRGGSRPAQRGCARADSGGPGGPQHRPEHSGKHVGVLVGIDVGERDAAGLKQRDLRGGFGFYPGGADAPGEKPLEECAQRGSEAARASDQPVWAISDAGRTGSPSTRTTWQPTPSVGVERAISMASSVAAALAISVVLVSTPARCSSRMARLTPAVSPKSSALRMRRPTGQVYQHGVRHPWRSVQSHECGLVSRRSFDATLRGAQDLVWMLSQGCAALHPGLFSFLPSGKSAVDPLFGSEWKQLEEQKGHSCDCPALETCTGHRHTRALV